MLQRLRSHSLLRGIATIATGTALAQLITFFFTPIITRLYGPEALGTLGIFNTAVTISSIVASLALPTAITLPKTDREAARITIASIYASVLICSAQFVTLAAFGSTLFASIGSPGLIIYAPLIPISAFLICISMMATQWLVRTQNHTGNARTATVNSFFVNAAKACTGYISATPTTLIITHSFGFISNAALTLIQLRPKLHDIFSDLRVSPIEEIRIFRDFPIYRMPQNLLNSISQGLPILLLSALFDIAKAGQYSIAQAALLTPSALLGVAITSVFYPHITKAINDGRSASNQIKKATIVLALFSAIPFLIIGFFGQEIFSIVFGREWSQAGIYAQILAPWLFFQLVNKPAVAALPGLKKQRGLLVYEIASTALKAASLWIGFSIFDSDIWALILFSGSGVISYIWLILWTIQSAQAYERNKAS